MGFSFPKGNGIKIIKKESEAVVNPSGGSIYLLPIDDYHAKMIIISKTGQRREVGIGARAWVPVIVTDSDTIEGKTFLKISDWTGGVGEKPTEFIGMWMKDDGTYTENPEEAENLKGEPGKMTLFHFEINEDMELIEYSTNPELDFHLENGDLKLTFD